MKNILENSIISALQKYLEKEGLKQNALAEKLGWSPQDLNDTLQGRKPVGKTRQAHIKKALGKTYEQLLLKELAKYLEKEIGEFEGLFDSVAGKQKSGHTGESLADYAAQGDTADEREYTGKLVNIFRKKDGDTVKAVKQTIDTLLRMPDNPAKS